MVVVPRLDLSSTFKMFVLQLLNWRGQQNPEILSIYPMTASSQLRLVEKIIKKAGKSFDEIACLDQSGKAKTELIC